MHNLSADITHFICSNVELVHTMLRLEFYRFLQWLIPGGYQVYVLLANTGLSYFLVGTAVRRDAS